MRSLAGRLWSPVRQLRHSEKAQGLVEYALIVAIVSLGAIASLTFFRDNITGLFSKTGNNLSSSTSPPPAPVITSGPAQPTTTGPERDVRLHHPVHQLRRVQARRCGLGRVPGHRRAVHSPLSVAAHQFQVRATNDFGTSPEANWDWTILGSPPPSGTPVTLPSGPPFNTHVTYYYYPAGRSPAASDPDGSRRLLRPDRRSRRVRRRASPSTAGRSDPAPGTSAFWTGRPGHPILVLGLCQSCRCPRAGPVSLAPNPAGPGHARYTADASNSRTGQVDRPRTSTAGSGTTTSTARSVPGRPGTPTTRRARATATRPATAADGDRCYRVVVTGLERLQLRRRLGQRDDEYHRRARTAAADAGVCRILVAEPARAAPPSRLRRRRPAARPVLRDTTFHWERNAGSELLWGTALHRYDVSNATASTSDTDTGHARISSTTATAATRCASGPTTSPGSRSAYTSYSTPVQVLPLPAAPTINSGPNNAGNDAAHTAPSFTFTAGANTTSLECRFDTGGSQGSWGACTSPKGYGPGLGVNSYQFNVRGTGPGRPGRRLHRGRSRSRCRGHRSSPAGRPARGALARTRTRRSRSPRGPIRREASAGSTPAPARAPGERAPARRATAPASRSAPTRSTSEARARSARALPTRSRGQSRPAVSTLGTATGTNMSGPTRTTGSTLPSTAVVTTSLNDDRHAEQRPRRSTNMTSRASRTCDVNSGSVHSHGRAITSGHGHSGHHLHYSERTARACTVSVLASRHPRVQR